MKSLWSVATTHHPPATQRPQRDKATKPPHHGTAALPACLCRPMLEAKECALRLDQTGDHRLVLILESEAERDAWVDAINFEA